MNKIDKPALKLIRERIDIALAPLGKEFGLKFHAGSCHFTDTTADFKLEVLTISDGGEVQTKEAQSYRELHTLYNLPADGLGKEIKWGLKTYILTGLNPKKEKFPLVCKNIIDGKIYGLPIRAMNPDSPLA